MTQPESYPINSIPPSVPSLNSGPSVLNKANEVRQRFIPSRNLLLFVVSFEPAAKGFAGEVLGQQPGRHAEPV